MCLYDAAEWSMKGIIRELYLVRDAGLRRRGQ